LISFETFVAVAADVFVLGKMKRGSSVIIDFEKYLRKREIFYRFLDKDLFARFKTKHGGAVLTWNGNVLDFPAYAFLSVDSPFV